jgi:hypothetical protein
MARALRGGSDEALGGADDVLGGADDVPGGARGDLTQVRQPARFDAPLPRARRMP